MPIESRQYLVDPEWEDYQIELTRGWAKNLHKLVTRENKLWPHLFDLVGDLRYIAITASLPATLAMQLPVFAAAFTREDVTPSVSRQVIDVISKRLTSRLAERRIFAPDALLEIRAECLAIQEQLHATSLASVQFTTKHVWSNYVQNPGFRFGLWGGQRIAFVAAFNTYDNFLTRAVGIALGRPNFRRKSPEKFEAAIRENFGDDVLKSCWTDEAVEIPRLARHSLSHCGGRETDELKRKADHGFPVYDEILQVTTIHLKRLLKIIEARANTIAIAARDHPQFRRKPAPGS